MNLRWQSSRVFSLFFIASLIVSVLVSVSIVGQRAEGILLSLQKNSSQAEASQTIDNISQFLDNRLLVLLDISRVPIVANSVMGSEAQMANLIDYLDSLTILGNKEQIEVVNILGEPVYANALDAQQPEYAELPWFNQMLEGLLDFKFLIVEQDNQHYFKIAVPILYSGFTEGVLVVKFLSPLEDLVSNFVKNQHAVSIASQSITYKSYSSNQGYTKISSQPIKDTGLIFDYYINQHSLDAEKKGFMQDIAFAVVASLGFSFLLLGVFGKRYIVNPFKQLSIQEQETKASEERYQLAVEGSLDGIWDWDLVRDQVYFSPNFLSLLGDGFLSGELTLSSFDDWQQRIHPEDLEANDKCLNGHLNNENEYNLEYRLLKENGQYGYFRVKGCALRDDSGRPVRMAGSFSDITEEKLAEVALSEVKARNELLAQAIEAAPIGITISDAKQQDLPLIYVNNGFLRLTGYNAEEVIGRNCRFLQGAETDRAVVNRFKQGIVEKKPHVEEILNYRKDGSSFWSALHISPIYDELRDVIAYVGIQKDITERKEFESQLELAKIEAESASRIKSNFLASMSHEIRTPMNGVIGMLNVLADGQLTSAQQQEVRIATNSANSLLSLINDILDFSKIEAGRLDLEHIVFDAKETIEECVESAAVLVNHKPIELVLDTSEVKISCVKGDPNRIYQIITNILSNAIKFTKQGEVCVVAKTQRINDKELLLNCKISDTGIGIEEDKIAMLFDSFTQADASTTRQFGGTGLGLAIVKKLCEMMGGHVNVISEVGLGSTFEFSIRLAAMKDRRKDSSRLLTDDLSSLKALVVENNPRSRASFCKMLSSMNIDVIGTDTKGVYRLVSEYCQTKAFDFVFLCCTTDSLAGIELCQQLAENKPLSNTGFILVSGNSVLDEEELQAIGEAGFLAYMNKPVTTKDMLGVLMLSSQSPEQLSKPVIARSLVDNAVRRQKCDFQHIPQQVLAKKILLVEDNEINQVVAHSLLNKLGFNTVDTANNGLIAVDKLKQCPLEKYYDVVLMDCQMPELDGYDATREIRNGAAGEAAANLPIIAMTANAMRGDKEKCLSAGMSDYIAKPADENELKGKLVKWLS